MYLEPTEEEFKAEDGAVLPTLYAVGDVDVSIAQ
jgi:hypothetical protein